MTDNGKNQKNRMPVFTNIEEEAAFWGTHSVLDYLDDFATPQFVSKITQT